MKYRLYRPSVSSSETPNDTQSLYEEQDYEQYYDLHYSQYEEESVYNEQRKRNGIVFRSTQFYRDKSEEFKKYWTDNVSLQKSYYKDRDSHWLVNQQKARTDDFIRKLIFAIVCIGILTAFMYIMTAW